MSSTDTWNEIREMNERAWDDQQRTLQQRLADSSLADALFYLLTFESEIGFIEDDLSQTKIFSLPGDVGGAGAPRFWLQFNPRRGQRTAIGRTGGCVFEVHDLRRQQRGLQYFFQFFLNNSAYRAFTTPFPFAPSHVSIASATHEPQGWAGLTPEDRLGWMRRVVADVYALVASLPGWCVGYNGDGAGSTVNEHLHFHVFRLPDGVESLPLQAVASERAAIPDAVTPLHANGSYPLTAFRVRGSQRFVVDSVTGLLHSWADAGGGDATANLFGAIEESSPTLYAVPRSRTLEYAPGFSARIGFLETTGLFVMSKESDLELLNSGRLTHRTLWNVLRAVDPARASRLVLKL